MINFAWWKVILISECTIEISSLFKSEVINLYETKLA